MHTTIALALAAIVLIQSSPPRPKILGIAHLAVFVSDLAASGAFYKDLLGFEQSLPVTRPDRSVDSEFIKINDRQWIELLNRPAQGEGQLDHIALYTDDVERMRQYLAGKGVEVPGGVRTGPMGELTFTIRDPDGHRVEFVEYRSDTRAASGGVAPTPVSAISERALHVGILVGDLPRATAFYSGVLGLQETWRGSAAKSQTLSWVNMRVPDGTDYLEFMLYEQKPAPDRRGTAHHLCLMVADAAKAVAALEARPARKGYTRPIEIRTGINRKRQVNLFDPDGTRVELMEPDTIDGRPAPPSTLPAPRGKE